MRYSGFPAGTRFTPVPDPLLGPLLGSIEDLTELKCILRCLWLLHQKKGRLRYVTEAELASDPVLVQQARGGLGPVDQSIIQALTKATHRGVFVSAQLATNDATSTIYVLNTPADRQVLKQLESGSTRLPVAEDGLALQVQPLEGPRNIYALYEENIGILTPLIGERLKEAQDTYPWTWVREAFEIAVAQNRRSWSYIERILERWAREGKGDGEPGGHSQKIDRERYFKAYLRRRGPAPSP